MEKILPKPLRDTGIIRPRQVATNSPLVLQEDMTNPEMLNGDLPAVKVLSLITTSFLASSWKVRAITRVFQDLLCLV